jgi:hypothetical protein
MKRDRGDIAGPGVEFFVAQVSTPALQIFFGVFQRVKDGAL